MTTTEFTSFFVILLISLASAHARNAILLKNTELAFLEDSISKESTLDPSQVDLFCNSCLEVSKRLEVILSDSTLLEKANMVLTDVCNLLPSDVQEKCIELSEAYINQTITFIQVALSQKNLCYSTGLCSGSAKSVFIGEKEISDEGRCTKCHTAVAELRRELDNPETKMKLIRALLKACENVETHVKECKKIVFKYGPLILANLDEYMSNNDLCDMLHMCDFSTPLTIESSPIVQLIELPVTRHFRITPTKMVM